MQRHSRITVSTQARLAALTAFSLSGLPAAPAHAALLSVANQQQLSGLGVLALAQRPG